MVKEVGVIPPTTLRRLMKNCDASIVSKDAIIALREYLTNRTVQITKKALTLAQHAKRKTVAKQDIKLAL